MLVADIGGTVDRAFTEFFGWLPNVLGAVLVLALGWLAARLVGELVYRGLRHAGVDRVARAAPGGRYVERLTASPARLLGTVAFWAVLVGAVSLAVSVLGVQALEDLVASVFGYLPNVIAAVGIFLLAGLVATAVAAIAPRALGDTGLGRVVAAAGPVLVMTIATFMALDQLRIAETIVTITYAGLVGAISLGAALAFGLGGRDVARDVLQGAYERRQEWRRDLDAALSRAASEQELSTEDATRRLESGARHQSRETPA